MTILDQDAKLFQQYAGETDNWLTWWNRILKHTKFDTSYIVAVFRHIDIDEKNMIIAFKQIKEKIL